MSFFEFPMAANIDMISPRPVLLVAGANAHSLYYSEDVFNAASDPKELLIVPNADHVDLYDNLKKIPFDKLEGFFGQNLNGAGHAARLGMARSDDAIVKDIT